MNEPISKRKRQWIVLNEFRASKAKKGTTNDSPVSTAYFSVTWSNVKSLLNSIDNVQTQLEINDEHLNFLARYLSLATNALVLITGWRLSVFISLLLVWCVSAVFSKGNLDGNFVKAKGRFEFTLRRKNKAVCIVEVKNTTLKIARGTGLGWMWSCWRSWALDIVYRIVTTYAQWIFLRSFDDKAEMEECYLTVTRDGPQQELLKIIPEKIYTMISG